MVLFVPVCNSLLHPFSGVGNRVLVDVETIEPESETNNNNNLETKSERSRDGVCRQVGNLSEDSEAPTLELESDNDKLETDSEDSRDTGHCGVEYGALLDLHFCSQK